MIYKFSFFIVGFLTFSLTTSIAQDTLQVASSSQKAEAVATRMERELSLTKDQTEKIKTIAVDRFEMLKVKKSNFSSQLTAANDQAQKKLEGILTKEQWELYKQLKNDTQKQKDEYLRKNPNYKFSTMELEMDF